VQDVHPDVVAIMIGWGEVGDDVGGGGYERRPSRQCGQPDVRQLRAGAAVDLIALPVPADARRS